MELTKKISPSFMCADFMELQKCLRELEESKAEYLHIDVMDGSFVPNYTLGTDFCKVLKKNTHIPLDIHLMIDSPEYKLSWFPIGEGDYVSVHYESTPHIHRALQQIKSLGAKPMVALNPATPLSTLEYLLDDIDAVLLMTVNPGFAGQKLVEATLKKISDLRQFLDSRDRGHIEIEVDGNVSFENARKMSDRGANIFVAGSSSIFSPSFSLTEGIKRLRRAIE
ncbi:MAG: ribulose-phosphate 3-epimerase [Ruminococcaceae bacterium]|nr:ribulose-phosphate 3-epimerase [Oscillospiraceae bacterium]